jgi:hypothetical protein
VLAAAPAWFSDNLGPIAGGTLLVVTVLIVRMVQKAMLRMVLLGIVVVIALFVYVNRRPLETCARTCQCSIAGQHLTVPTCDSDLKL